MAGGVTTRGPVNQAGVNRGANEPSQEGSVLKRLGREGTTQRGREGVGGRKGWWWERGTKGNGSTRERGGTDERVCGQNTWLNASVSVEKG